MRVPETRTLHGRSGWVLIDDMRTVGKGVGLQRVRREGRPTVGGKLGKMGSRVVNAVYNDRAGKELQGSGEIIHALTVFRHFYRFEPRSTTLPFYEAPPAFGLTVVCWQRPKDSHHRRF